MKAVSNDYKNQIKQLGREIDSVITYYNHYSVITENNKYILTEDGQKLLTEQINEGSTIDILADDIYSCKVITHGQLFKTMMKEFDFEVKQDIKVGSVVSYKFGLKVEDDYEYVDYGMFIVQQKEYNEDTQTYTYVAYDKMLFTMIPYKPQDISEMVGTYTLYDLTGYICEFSGLELGVEEFPNGEREITDDTLNLLKTSNLTCRDILDYITEVTGCSSYIYEDYFVITPPNETNLTLGADSFKDTNVKFDKAIGPINSILFSRSEDTDVIEIKDDESIATNGVTQIKIKDNPFLEGNDRSDYFEEMFDVLDGLNYTINDLSSIGITYLEYMDKFNVTIGNNTYPCLLLNDEINVVQGLEETIFTEEIEETTKEYVTSRISDKDEKWANIQVKKDLGVISLEVGQKVNSDEIISAINLSTEQAEINSNKISLNGKTIGLTSDNITINSTNFNVDSQGNVTCNSASMNNVDVNGGNIVLVSQGQNARFIVQDKEDSSVKWSQSARKLTWDGLNGGLFTIANMTGTPVLGCVASDSTSSMMSAYEVQAPIITPGSLEEYKKNFEVLDSGLDILKNIDIYKYNLKFEKDNDKKHIGLVIGDKYKYSKDVTNNNNNGVDLYSFVSVCCKAIQEQQEQIEKLERKIEELERIGK